MIMNKEKGKEGREEGKGGGECLLYYECSIEEGRPETCAIIRFHIVGNVRNY